MSRAAVALLALSLAGGCATGPSPSSVPPGAPLPVDATEAPERYIVVTVPNLGVPLPTRAGSTLRGYDDFPAYSVSSAAESAARAIATDYGLEQVSAWPIAVLRVHCVMYRTPEGEAREAVLARLATDRRVQLAQPLQTFATSAADYDDEYVDLQRGFEEMSIAAAHQWSLGAGVTVAIVDTGVDLTHPDLKGRVRASQNFVDHDQREFSLDRHGTEIAGVIAAVGNNGRGIVGIAPRVELLVLKACWQRDPASQVAMCNTYTLAQALAAAIAARADVINMSLVGPADPLLAALTERAISAGSIVVGAVPAAGDLDGFPAGAPGVLPVAMAEQSRVTAALQAPGRGILTLVPNGSYDFATGSSISTASVSGVVALLCARKKDVTAAEAHAVLARTTRDLLLADDQPVRSIDACTALAALLGKHGCPSRTRAADASRMAGATAQSSTRR